MPNPENLPEWTPDPASLPALVKDYSATRFSPSLSVKMADGYDCHQKEIPESKDILFRAKNATGGFFPGYEISISPIRRFVREGEDAQAGFKRLLDSETIGTHQSSLSKVELGQINHQPFFRGYFTRWSPRVKKMTRGFIYGTIFDNLFVFMAAQDTDDSASKSLPVLEASARTIKLWK